MEYISLPKQPSLFLSYLRVGKLLYYSLFLFIVESWIFLRLFDRALNNENIWLQGLWLVCFLFSFVHIFLVIMDGWSRFQNYKRAKDQFFEYGYQNRIAANYIGSKCQRAAALEAAKELGICEKVEQYYEKRGVKWYHYVPYFMVRDPLFFFKKAFWSRTFMEKTYTPKFDYKKIQLELSS